MKSLIYILGFVFLLTACSKSDPEPTFDTLEGNWSFQAKTMTANFRIQKSAGDLVITTGEYTVNGSKFLVGTQYKLINPITELRLIEGSATKYMVITVTSIPSTNDAIFSKNIQSNSIPGLVITSFEEVTIKRTQ